MKKIFLVLVLFLMAFTVFAREVPATNQGIANASPGDHIIRANGERVILRQADIDYARRQLGLSTAPVTQNRSQQSTANMANTQNRTTSNSGSEYGGLVIFLLIVVVIAIIIGKCVSNITTTVAKNSGMNENDAKKVGNSAGVLAGTAATIAAAALLGKSGGVKRNPNDLTITHKQKK